MSAPPEAPATTAERRTSEKSKTQLVAALIQARRAFASLTKDKTAQVTSEKGKWSYKYTDLAQVLEVTREGLCANDLALIQSLRSTEQGLVLITRLVHTSGESETSEYPIRPVKQDPQGVGSAITYARRYSALTMLGIAPEDDDGRAACGPDAAASEPRNKRPAGRTQGPAPSANGANGHVDTPPSNAPRIKPAQAQELENLCLAKGRTAKSLCQRFGIKALADLPADKFPLAKNGLESLAYPAQVKELEALCAAKGQAPEAVAQQHGKKRQLQSLTIQQYQTAKAALLALPAPAAAGDEGGEYDDPPEDDREIEV